MKNNQYKNLIVFIFACLVIFGFMIKLPKIFHYFDKELHSLFYFGAFIFLAFLYPGTLFLLIILFALYNRYNILGKKKTKLMGIMLLAIFFYVPINAKHPGRGSVVATAVLCREGRGVTQKQSHAKTLRRKGGESGYTPSFDLSIMEVDRNLHFIPRL